MGFDIKMTWQREDPAPEQRNERLAAAILDQFPGLERFPLDLDHDLVAKTIGVPRQDVLQHWRQIEIDDRQENLSGAIVTIRLWGVNGTTVRSQGFLCRGLEPTPTLFRSPAFAWFGDDRSANLLERFQAQRRRVEQVGRLLQRPWKPHQDE